MKTSPQYSRLFEPFKIGKLTVRNRLVMAPCLTRFSEDGFVNDRQIDYYAERAKGGAGIIIPEAFYACAPYPGRLFSFDDKFIPGMKKLSDAVHRAGAAIFQEVTPGRASVGKEVTDAPTVYNLTPAGIKDLVERFGDGMKRARDSGYDGVQLHGAHGYLICEFLTRKANQRTDEYGGDIANRARFLVELIKIAKKKAGNDFPVTVRLSLIDHLDFLTLEEGLKICQLAQEAGADALDITSGVSQTIEFGIPPYFIPKGNNVPLSEAVKKVVQIPVGVAGSLDPEIAEKVLAEGKADYILIGRGFITDPYFPTKLREGKAEDIRRCIRCLHCTDSVEGLDKGSLTCTVNPEVGRERFFNAKLAEKAPKSKKVLIIGAGGAGMEAARVAATRGHKVTIWEAQDKLGGRINIAALPPFKEELLSIIKYYQRVLSRLGVKIELNKEASAEQVAKAGFDAVIVADGGLSAEPRIPGLRSIPTVTADDLLMGKAKVGKNVVVIGGGLVGCEVAELLVEQGHTVTVAELLERLVTNAPAPIRRLLVRKLREKGVTLLPGVSCHRVTAEGIEMTKENQEQVVKPDSIVVATGYRKNLALYEELQKRVKETYLVGDANEPGNIYSSITSGADTALKL